MKTWELTFPFVSAAADMDDLMTKATGLLVDALDGQDLDPSRVQWGGLKVGRREGELRFVVEVTVLDEDDMPCPLCGQGNVPRGEVSND